LLPDSGSRYLSKVFNDDWMRENGFLEPAWGDYRAADIHGVKGSAAIITARPTDSLADTVRLLKEHNISQLPVVDENGRLLGMINELALLNRMLIADQKPGDNKTIAPLIDPNVTVIRPNTPLESLMAIFSASSVAVIANGDELQGILTKIDILDFLASHMG
jgi:cystathionine beta-synthase